MQCLEDKLKSDVKLVENKLREIAIKYDSTDYVSARTNGDFVEVNNSTDKENYFSYWGKSDDIEIAELMTLLKRIRGEQLLESVSAFIMDDYFSLTGIAFEFNSYQSNEEELTC